MVSVWATSESCLRPGKDGLFDFAPRAVMDAGYTGIQQKPRRTDTGAIQP
ncbi:MAG: hypothetical protein ACE5LV_05470 [Candidatus Aminicenantales bacterium]